MSPDFILRQHIQQILGLIKFQPKARYPLLGEPNLITLVDVIFSRAHRGLRVDP